ncbi:GcrA family cell cycle regulator [Sphingomonas sp. LB-2]|uniref:GcrA family cell cycle regulator n=1 Tax=Sphingomonas caeni TaxID=2984949 RepID=UPI002232817A|nr:GcrA family cell cycle regulator [Sphingomonas caeni]MCW3848902.1 GcrA family cell cycle regulator [Sphingomonas caeni]
MSWTDERIETLKKMWDSGLTATQIAEELGGVSRNAVIGKAHRLGLPARPSPVKPNEAKAAAASAPAEPRPAPVPRAAPEPAAPRAAAPAAAAASPAGDAEPAAAKPDGPTMRSVGPGGFLRQNPGEQSAPIQPAPPRRLVPAKPSDAIAGKTTLLDLNDRICKWPLGHPGEPDFHFCGDKVNPGFPYCVDHCGHAYQAQLPRRDRRPPPPLPFGGPRVR